MKSVIEFSHQLLADNLKKNDVAIDTTVGNGNDMLFLVSRARFVYGFDIQSEACNQAEIKLTGYDNFRIINQSHLFFMDYVKEEFRLVIFNLGYLPGGNKNITTTAPVTLDTVKLVLQHIAVTGICLIVVYPGHPEGHRESELLQSYLSGLDQKKYHVLKYQFINQINDPPYLLAVRRIE